MPLFGPPSRASGQDPNDMGALGAFGNFLFGGDATRGLNTNMPHGQFGADYSQNMLGSIANRQAPQFQSADAAQARQQQQQLAAMLQRQASGQQAGAGELAVNRQVGQANAAQQAQAMMARGQNAALAARGAARNTADIGVSGAGQAAIAQMQDQINAQNQLNQLLGGMRGQDIGIGQGNQQASLTNQGQIDQATMGYLANMLGVDQAQLQAELQKRQLAAGDKGVLPSLLTGIGTKLAGGGK